MKRRLVAALLLTALAAHAQELVPAVQVRTSGRMVATPAGWLATWPGTRWMLRFEGRAVGVRLDDAFDHWVLELDGAPAAQIAPEAGERTVWLRGLSPGVHRVELIKRTESSQQAARVIGFVLDEGQVLPPSPAEPLRIEFIGDSYTAALGNLSTTRACTRAETGERTDITQGYAVLAARALGADWRIHARTGAGLVRNYAGSRPGETHGTDYARVLQSDPASRETGADGWKPDLVVIGLGTNDLSTPVKPGEPRDAAALDRDLRSAYRALLASVHQRYGEPGIVLLSAPLGNGNWLRALADEMAAEEKAAGHGRIRRLDWGALSAQGCGSHPDLQDHRRMGERLAAMLQGLR